MFLCLTISCLHTSHQSVASSTSLGEIKVTCTQTVIQCGLVIMKSTKHQSHKKDIISQSVIHPSVAELALVSWHRVGGGNHNNQIPFPQTWSVQTCILYSFVEVSMAIGVYTEVGN